MRASQRLQERSATSTGDLMLHGFSDEAASVPLKLVHFLKEIRRQRYGDSSGSWHNDSMT